MSLPPKENALFKRILVSGGAARPGLGRGERVEEAPARTPSWRGAEPRRRRPERGSLRLGQAGPSAACHPRPVPPSWASAGGRRVSPLAHRVPALAVMRHPGLREIPRSRFIHCSPLQPLSCQPTCPGFALFFFFAL